MPKNEVATVNNKMDLSMFQNNGEGILGFEEISAEDIKMPRIKICQPTSLEVGDEKAKPGDFYNVTEDVAYEGDKGIIVRLLKISKSKARWASEFKRGDKPLCRSLDANKSVDGQVCANCEYAKWTGNDRPACQQGYTWLGLLEDDKPFRISLKGSAIGPTKTLITEISRLNVPPFTFKVKITTKKEKNEKGTYYVPVYEILKDESGNYLLPTKDEWDSFRDTLQGLSSMFARAVEQDLVTVDESAAGSEEELF